MKVQDFLNENYKEVALESFKRVQDVQEQLNATVTFVDPSERLNEELNGKLKGVTIAVKDNVNTKGIRTTACSKILDNYIPVYNAHIMDLLEKEGAVLVSKASMDELAMGGTNLTSFIGPCKNPYDLNRISGGSSGGSAALVASGAVPVAIGSDTGDSVRKPASFCGIVGVKPSYGRISRYGVIPYASSLDHVAYFTTNVKDAALMLEVLAGRDDRDMTSSYEPVLNYSELLSGDVKGKKIVVFNNVVKAISNPEVVKLFNKVVEGLKEKGAEIKVVDFDQALMRAILPTYYIIANAEATANHSNLDGILYGNKKEADSTDDIMIQTRTEGFGPWIKKRFVVGSYALFEENQDRVYRKAQKVRRLIVEEIMKELKEADALIAPASGDVATPLTGKKMDEMSDEYLIVENHMAIGNFAGLPSVTIPMGEVNGLPIGVNLTCNAFKEADMFDIAKAIEENTGLEGKTKEDL